MKYYIITGEASGDLHGSNLMKEILKEDPLAEFRFWGGDLMEKVGGKLVKHYRELAFMGFVEVIANLRTILNNISLCKKDIVEYQPDAVILIDYPGFNLRIAEFAHRKGLKVFYYISPQVWAWKKSRVHKIRRTVDRMFVILPFEVDFYRQYGMEVDFVGHPLLDAITLDEIRHETTAEVPENPVIALLPGSRKQEITGMLPIMASIKPRFPKCQFIIGAASAIEDEFYKSVIGDTEIEISRKGTLALLRSAHAALVTSGTATLETAILGVPEVVCYRGNEISYQIAKRIVKVPHISLVNLLMGKEIVRELIQRGFNKKNLETELRGILDPATRQLMISQFSLLREKLGGAGASSVTAKKMVSLMKK